MDILEFAIKMELDGEKYYNEQAAINQDNSLNIIFLTLAKDEKNHAKILTRKSKGLSFELNEPVHTAIKNVFNGKVDFKSEIIQKPHQLDIYRMALEMERKSIELYEKLFSAETNDKSKELFQYLGGQEKNHFAIIEELVLLVNRPNEWVEAAEFGLREKY